MIKCGLLLVAEDGCAATPRDTLQIHRFPVVATQLHREGADRRRRYGDGVPARSMTIHAESERWSIENDTSGNAHVPSRTH